MTRRALPAAVVAGLLALVLLPLLAATPASAARTITVMLTASGPQPASTTAAVGDTVVFTNADLTFIHQVQSKSTNWAFRSQPLAPGQSFSAPTLTKAGEYDYEGANLDAFTGKVVVPGGTTASPAPAPSRTAGATGPTSASRPASSTAASASPSPTAGTGVVGPPPLAGGFGTVGVPGFPAPGASALPPAVAPNVAPTLAGEDASSPAASGGNVAIGSGRLPEPPTGRRYGLPAALAAVAAAGVASLLVRVLLAHPAGRHTKKVADLPAAVD